MKYRNCWAAIVLLAPLSILLSLLVVPFGCGGGGGGSPPSPVPTLGNVMVGFVGQSPSQSRFRNVLLNISAVRINAQANAPVDGGGWVTIPVPAGTGNGTGESTPADLQIDLNNLQNAATLFNNIGVPVSQYLTLQVVVDPSNPGTIVPACQSIVSNQEGCANYPIVFSNPSQALTLSFKPPGISVSQGALATVLVEISIPEATFDTSNQTFTVNPTLSTVQPDSFLGVIRGTVSGVSAASVPLTVSAELSGTGLVVSSVPVSSSGTYTLALPANSGIGTLYDVYVFASGVTYDTSPKPINLTPGAEITQNFTVSSASAGSINGTVSDVCTGAPIQAATVQLLAPPRGKAIDCSTAPASCVTVASTSTDDAGNYPLPPTVVQPAQFTTVPIGNGGLAIKLSASGYQTVIASAEPSAGAPTCGPPASSACNFSLESGYINGTVTLSQAPQPGTAVQVQVFAEESATNQLVSTLPMPLVFQSSQVSRPFTLNVPPGGTFDLFATAIDPFLGATDPYPGHTIAVVAGLEGPAAACRTASTSPTLGNLDCVGHGSASGTVKNPDLATTVEALKDGVQLFGTPPGLLSSTSPLGGNTAYTLCVPPDTYVLQRFENQSPATPASEATVIVPSPAPTSSPCPSTCSISSSQCPGQCSATNVGPL